MRNRKLITWTLVTVLSLIAGVASASDGKSDATTTLKVKLALLDKLGGDSLQINVDTVAGAVALNGTVDKRETMELASTIARSVANVASVTNNLRLESKVRNPNQAEVAVAEAEAEVEDAVLETRIRLALVDKLGTDGFRIGTEAASGVVTLEFEPAWSSTLRKDAIAVARQVEGVNKVVSVDKKS